MSTKIILADDHQIVRDGLRALLEKQPHFEVVCEAKDGRTAVRLAKELSPDLVIMDLSMQQLNGIEASRKIINNLLNNQSVVVADLGLFSICERLRYFGGRLAIQSHLGSETRVRLIAPLKFGNGDNKEEWEGR